jgi:hypothetical protein
MYDLCMSNYCEDARSWRTEPLSKMWGHPITVCVDSEVITGEVALISTALSIPKVDIDLNWIMTWTSSQKSKVKPPYTQKIIDKTAMRGLPEFDLSEKVFVGTPIGLNLI